MPTMDPVETWLLIVIMVVAVPLVLLFIARRAARSRVDPTEVTIDPTLAATLVDMYHQGNKVQATKLLRERTGLALADAVRIVERLARRQSPGVPAADAATTGDDLVSAPEALDLDIEFEARSLVADGRKLEAMNIIRDRAGWSLRNAKEYVDRL